LSKRGISKYDIQKLADRVEIAKDMKTFPGSFTRGGPDG
jgi:hypothetical protein